MSEVLSKYQKHKDINKLNIELGNLWEETTYVIGKALGLKLTATFKTCDDCAKQLLQDQKWKEKGFVFIFVPHLLRTGRSETLVVGTWWQYQSWLE